MDLKIFSVIWFIVSIKLMYDIVNEDNNYLVKISVKYNYHQNEEDEELKRDKKVRKKLKKIKLEMQKQQIKYKGIPKLMVYFILVIMAMIPVIINFYGAYVIYNSNIDMLHWEVTFLFTSVILQAYNRMVLCLADIYKAKYFFTIGSIDKIKNIEDCPKFSANTFLNGMSQFMILYVSVELLEFLL